MSTSQKRIKTKKAINNIKDVINIKTTVITFFSTAVALMGFYGVVVGFLGNDNVFSLWLKTWHLAYKIITVIVASLLTTSIQIIWAFCAKTSSIFNEIESLRNELKESNNKLNEKEAFIKEHSDSICDILDQAMNKKRYNEVVTLGMSLSKPLWYSGQYILRIKIGSKVQKAAFHLGDKATQADVLIEDLGWTNVKIGKYDEGIQFIERGLHIASEINNSFLIAQAKRNLAHYELIRAKGLLSLVDKQEAMDRCKAQIDEALFVAEKMKKSDAQRVLLGNIHYTQKELLGNIHYTFSRYYLEMGDKEQALVSLERSLEIYQEIGFIEKQIKLYHLKGEILTRQSDQGKAIDAFQDGLQLAQKANVNVETAANALALCEIYIQKEDYESASQALSEATEVIATISDPATLKRYEDCLSLLADKKDK